MRLPAGPLAEVTHFPMADITRDIDSFHLRVDRSAAAARLLHEIVGDIHLPRAAFVLGFRGAIATVSGCRRHGSTPPLLVVVRLCSDLLCLAIDGPGRSAELLLRRAAKARRFT